MPVTHMQLSLRNRSSSLQKHLESLSKQGFKKIFERIDLYGIKKSVDTLGLDKFINQCAYIAAGTGVITGSGGAFTMIVGLPVDVINTITQQFRVTLAIIYSKRGTYKMSFEEFVSFVATSMKVEAGITVTKTMLEEIAIKLLTRIGTESAAKLIPVVGGVIGGSANYIFIKRMAASVKKMDL